MIRIQDLNFSYPEGDFQLDIPSLEFEKGSKAAIVGPSGSGKTTFLNLLSGITIPNRGQITVAGKAIHHLGDGERRNFRIKNIGFIFQDFELLEYLNTLDNILLPFRINNSLKLKPSVRRRAISLAEGVGVQDKLQRNVEHLSHGERQRVAICRALLTQPKILLADEATGNLDPANKGRILEILFRYVEEEEASLIAVTHDHQLLKDFDQVIDFQNLQGGDPANG